MGAGARVVGAGGRVLGAAAVCPCVHSVRACHRIVPTGTSYPGSRRQSGTCGQLCLPLALVGRDDTEISHAASPEPSAGRSRSCCWPSQAGFADAFTAGVRWASQWGPEHGRHGGFRSTRDRFT